MPATLVIRSSAIHAAGCYTTTPIRKGARIVEYDGPRITKDVADERYADRFVTYLFGVGDRNTVIDGFGAAMFINHSCDPNCETQEIDERVFVVAIRNIAPGEELTYEYNLYDSDEEDQPCYCGATVCRGTMFSEDEIRRRKRIAARTTKAGRA
ncbi:MAG: SET domain-containing protein-lysine N-methyltransferase [Acidobacteriaceae bacterium]|nr:SET domain-containing protein-lysine N-methyltransferase [Acidobacteriaceae bacterium]